MMKTDHPLRWTVAVHEEFTVSHFDIVLPDGLLRESLLPEITLPAELSGREPFGVIFSGRGPVWLFAYLVHLAHPFAWLGIYDPRFAGAVVVSRHRPEAPAVGAVVPCRLPRSSGGE